MHFLRHSLSSHLRGRRHPHHRHVRTLYDAVSSINCPRDRGFDHAVERERHLKPLLNLKNLIISEPSKSIPLTLIAQSKETLELPFRPIEFTRKYRSIFEEFHPGSLNIQPHIKLTPEVVSLSSEEDLLYQSVNYKQEIAGRLLKLLMISRINKIPIILLERLKWELGLPQDYEEVIIPEFPDYFRVIGGESFGDNGKVLELVCWSDEFAVSELEKKGAKDGKIRFCLQFSNGFEMDKKYKKWVDEWQKLPYVSPYENAMHLAAKTDESDKWAVAVLHELLNLFVGKKAERDSLLYLGEYLGLRARFKRAFLQHPGIFYVSSKIGTHTVVLRDAYKRGMLIERHPLMNMRYKYVQLMNVVKDEEKPKSTEKKTGIDVKKGEGEGQGEELEDGEGGEEEDAEMYDSSDDEESDDDEEAVESENATKRGRFQANFEEKNSRRGEERRTNRRGAEETLYKSSNKFSRRTNIRGGDMNVPRRSPKNLDVSENRAWSKTEKTPYSGSSTRFSRRTNTRGGDLDVSENRPWLKTEKIPYSGTSTRFSRRVNVRGGDLNVPRRFPQKMDVSENRAWSKTEKTPYSGNSTRFSRRTNIRGDDSNVPKRFPQKSDGSGNRRRDRITVVCWWITLLYCMNYNPSKASPFVFLLRLASNPHQDARQTEVAQTLL
ncbi:hypothetical protein BUALT_Bualt08G0131600 [Buddleja alternifolia]|uniref:PORR domain-containing protein n=1 Tax=Buddleja alternifolia TaxID=168488 RepID=A0AAV6X6D7_9LAMI|nr:hypothetical protein BUALT_Bualt08G0131600 [Buddleja alternifolia]